MQFMKSKAMKSAIISMAVLMLATGTLYLFVSSQEIADASQEFEQNVGQPQEFDGGAFIETAFFAAVGAAYIPIGLWATITRHTSKVPYILAIGGSVALIGLYILSRNADIPFVGQQYDVGFIDILSKVLQGGIIAVSAYIILSIRREKKASLLT
jgi:formate hydrogenlyase subunit 3/multisubunit Na+/H+ antiporter MnhD subunit